MNANGEMAPMKLLSFKKQDVYRDAYNNCSSLENCYKNRYVHFAPLHFLSEISSLYPYTSCLIIFGTCVTINTTC